MREWHVVARLFSLPFRHWSHASCLAFQFQSGMQLGAVLMLNLAVCPPAARSPNCCAKVPRAIVLLAACPSAVSATSSSIKVPRTIAKWTARPSAASAQTSGAAGHQHRAESQQIGTKRSVQCKGLNTRARLIPSTSLTGLTVRCSGR